MAIPPGHSVTETGRVAMDPFNTAVVAVLAFAVGVFSSHAVLGNKVTRALTLLEPIPGQLKSLDARITNVERVHFHRRSTDDLEEVT